jgi:hypothetical protein
MDVAAKVQAIKGRYLRDWEPFTAPFSAEAEKGDKSSV